MSQPMPQPDVRSTIANQVLVGLEPIRELFFPNGDGSEIAKQGIAVGPSLSPRPGTVVIDVPFLVAAAELAKTGVDIVKLAQAVTSNTKTMKMLIGKALGNPEPEKLDTVVVGHNSHAELGALVVGSNLMGRPGQLVIDILWLDKWGRGEVP